MRSSMVVLACVTLAACQVSEGGGDAVSPADTANENVVAGQTLAADGLSPEGRYRAVSEASGVVLIEELRTDGTYTFFDENGQSVEEGTFEQKTPELPCFTPNTDGAVQKCYNDMIGDDGIWRTTDPDTGEVFVLERIAEQP